MKTFLCLLPLILLSACGQWHLEESAAQQVGSLQASEPMGREVEAYRKVPGLLASEAAGVGLCEQELKNAPSATCRLTSEALMGSVKAAEELANAEKSLNNQEAAIYWYTVASENGGMRAMTALGRELYAKSSASSDAGRKLRAIFWLNEAANRGDLNAESLLNQIRIKDSRGTDSLTPGPSSPGMVVVQMPCEERSSLDTFSAPTHGALRCADIVALEKDALSGSAKAASRLEVFFGALSTSSSTEDIIYWNTVSVENNLRNHGDNEVETLGASLWKDTNATTNKTRGRYWLLQASRNGNAVATSVLREVGNTPK